MSDTNISVKSKILGGLFGLLLIGFLATCIGFLSVKVFGLINKPKSPELTEDQIWAKEFIEKILKGV